MVGIDLSALSAGFGANNRYPEREEWVPEVPQADPGLYLAPQLQSQEKKNRNVNRARLLEMVDQVEDAMDVFWSGSPPPPSSLYAGSGGGAEHGGLAAMSQLLMFMAEHGMGPLKLYG